MSISKLFKVYISQIGAAVHRGWYLKIYKAVDYKFSAIVVVYNSKPKLIKYMVHK